MAEPRWRPALELDAPEVVLALQAPPDNFNPGLAIERLYRELVEVEALAIAADEAVTMLPPNPSAKHKRILARLFTLVTKTADQASQALEKSEDMIAQLAAHMAARAAKRSPKRRADDPTLLRTPRLATRPARRRRLRPLLSRTNAGTAEARKKDLARSRHGAGQIEQTGAAQRAVAHHPGQPATLSRRPIGHAATLQAGPLAVS